MCAPVGGDGVNASWFTPVQYGHMSKTGLRGSREVLQNLPHALETDNLICISAFTVC